LVEEDVPVCDEAESPEADVEPDVWLDALLEPPWPEPAVEDESVEVLACAIDPSVEPWPLDDPDPVVDEPEVEVWVEA
jgi:hypothetical protein